MTVLASRQTAPHLHRRFAFREDGDTVMRALAMPDRTVARVFESARRKLLVARLDFLETHDVGTRLAQPVEYARQAPVDAVDVVGGDFHVRFRSRKN